MAGRTNSEKCVFRAWHSSAVKLHAGATPTIASLPVQAVIRDRDTWISGDDMFAAAVKSGGGGGGD